MSITIESLIEEGKSLQTGTSTMGMPHVTDDNYPL